MEKSNKLKIKIHIIPILFIGLLSALDQLTKYMITSKFVLYESKTIIKNVFSLTYIHNEGMAWGMFQGKQLFFLIITTFMLVLTFYVYNNIASKKEFTPVKICLVFLTSGAIGNLIDRVTLGYVIDFLHFELFDFPVFNVADIFVTVSMIVLFVLIAFLYSDDDLNIMLGIKEKEKKIEK